MARADHADERAWPGRPPRLRVLFASTPLFFVTFGTFDRQKALACPQVHAAFREAAEVARDFGHTVGRYVIMPDHVHLFVRIGMNGRVGRVVKALKDSMGVEIRKQARDVRVWQPGFFDRVIRSAADYGDKWAYVRENPVRAALVDRAESWPYQGEVECVRW